MPRPLSFQDLTVALACLVPCASAAAAVDCLQADPNAAPGAIYKNASYCPAARAENLLPLLTWQEKIGQMGGLRQLLQANLTYNATNAATILQTQSGTLSYGSQLNPAAGVLQYANQERRQHMNASLVPLITVTDSVNSIYVTGGTLFPATLSLAATFNVPYYEEVVAAIRDENVALGTRWVLSPELDIPKDPRYGRVGETYGEDAFLVTQFGKQYVRTMQAKDALGYVKVGCTIKHYVYGNPTDGINTASQYGGINHLYNDQLIPFIDIIRNADPLSIMISYATVDNVPMSVNTYMLQDVLREKLGFKGLIMSDAGAISNLHTQSHVASSAADAALKAARAGMQNELSPGQPAAFPLLINYVNESDVAQLVNEAALRMLEIKFATGTFDEPLPTLENLEATLRAPEHLAVNRNVSREAIVLLTNNNNTLPLSLKSNNATQKVAVLGPFADIINAGTYAPQISTNRSFGNSLVQSLQAQFGAANVLYEQGVDFVDTTNDTGIDAAVAAAKEAGLAVVSLGSLAVYGQDPLASKRTDGEFAAHADLGFPGLQQNLLDAVLAAGVPTVLVINAGQAFALNNYTLENCGAILHAFLGGEYTADAVVEILVGKVNPSGRMPISLPTVTGATPAVYDYLASDAVAQYTFPNLPRAVPMPFGYGLSYTTFTYGDATLVSSLTSTGEPAVNVSVTVSNTGSMGGKEVVQVYLHQEYSLIELPVKRLVAVEKVDIAAGAQRQVTFTLPVESLGYYLSGAWTRETANYTFMVGSSSLDVDLTSLSMVL
ncbi:hypothetical protein SBRCBS47491_008615 [Sporothrix bragantina]|uniref:beta-glucosidase n=1 Tax=Sporothrix bragantina TaxID=671064 RepID=A0ABP0CMW7_9PEZI